MDTQRILSADARWRRHLLRPPTLIALALLLSVGLFWLGLSGKGMALTVEGKAVSIATVSRGAMALNLRAAGVLVPSNVQWMGAQSEGRIERLLVQPGAAVTQGQVLLMLSNPQLLQRTEESRWQLEQGEAELKALQVTLESQDMNQTAAVRRAEFSASSAHLQWEADQELLKDGMVSKLAFQRSAFNVTQMDQSLALEQAQLQQHRRSMRAQLQAKVAAVAKLRKALQRDQDLVAALQVRAPMDGIVQELLLQPGQSVQAGVSLVKLAQADSLIAEIQVPEAMAREVQVGQFAEIDLRTGSADGLLPAEVLRIAPKVSNGVVKVSLGLRQQMGDRPWPQGARPDLTVDGTIAIAHLDDTLKVERPQFSVARSQASVFRVNEKGRAERVSVQFGPASVSEIAIERGLAAGDRIVVSDTSHWQHLDTLQID